MWAFAVLVGWPTQILSCCCSDLRCALCRQHWRIQELAADVCCGPSSTFSSSKACSVCTGRSAAAGSQWCVHVHGLQRPVPQQHGAAVQGRAQRDGVGVLPAQPQDRVFPEGGLSGSVQHFSMHLGFSCGHVPKDSTATMGFMCCACCRLPSSARPWRLQTGATGAADRKPCCTACQQTALRAAT